MAELSPAAQAVLDAAVLPCTIRQGIAAALRTAAYRLANDFTVRHEGFKGEYEEIVEVVRVDDLFAIADELEGSDES